MPYGMLKGEQRKGPTSISVLKVLMFLGTEHHGDGNWTGVSRTIEAQEIGSASHRYTMPVKKLQNGWGIFSDSEPDDGRIILAVHRSARLHKGREFKSQQAERRQYQRLNEDMLACCRRYSLSMRTRATHERSQATASKVKDKERYNARKQAAPASP
jgi:hypothetical protein